MNVLYRSFRAAWRVSFYCSLRVQQINPELMEREGGFVVAVSHLSHLEPVCVSTACRREIDWVTRREFYCHPAVSAGLDALNCIRIHRQGRPVSAIRESIRRVRQGRIVGIFPEGGVAKGRESVLRGGPIRRAVCSIAIRSGVPIVPCVVIGTDQLLKVDPWLPFRRGRLWMAYGGPVMPLTTRSTRCARQELAERVRGEFRRLYGEIQLRYGIEDRMVP